HLTRRAKPLRALLDFAPRHLWHPRGWRAWARRIGKHVQEGQVALLEQIKRSRKRLFRLGWKTRDDIGAEHDVGPQPPHLCAERDRILPKMPALHPLQDQIVA